MRHPAHQDRPRLAARRARRERVEELDPGVLGDPVDGHPGAPQPLQPLAEEEGRGAQVGAGLRHDAVHEGRAAAPDEVVDDRRPARPPPRSAPRAPTAARAAPRGAGSTRSRVTRVGGESVSGYIRSGPGRIRSKSVEPSANGWRVSLGTPSAAST